MKTLKSNRLRTGIVLSFFLLIGTFFVVKAMEKKEVVTTQVYVFNGAAGEEHLVNKYSLSTGTPTNCNGNGIRCEISAKANPSNPSWPLLDGTEQILNQRQ